MINGNHVELEPINVNYYMEWIAALKASEIHQHSELYMPSSDGGVPCLKLVMKLKAIEGQPGRFLKQEYLIAINVHPTDKKYGITYVVNLVLEDIAHAGK